MIDIAIIGAQKSATTFLYEALLKSKDIAPVNHKENYQFLFDNKIKTKENYLNLISAPQLMGYPFLIDKLLDNSPNVKMICILRDPFERMKSALNMFYQRGQISKKFFLEYKFKNIDDLSFIKKSFPKSYIDDPFSELNYIESWSFYGSILNNIIEKNNFDKSNLLVINYDDVIKGNLDDVFYFLGIKPIKINNFYLSKNSSKVNDFGFMYYLYKITIFLIKMLYLKKIINLVVPKKIIITIRSFVALRLKKRIINKNYYFDTELVKNIKKDLNSCSLTKGRF